MPNQVRQAGGRFANFLRNLRPVANAAMQLRNGNPVGAAAGLLYNPRPGDIFNPRAAIRDSALGTAWNGGSARDVYNATPIPAFVDSARDTWGMTRDFFGIGPNNRFGFDGNAGPQGNPAVPQYGNGYGMDPTGRFHGPSEYFMDPNAPQMGPPEEMGPVGPEAWAYWDAVRAGPPAPNAGFNPMSSRAMGVGAYGSGYGATGANVMGMMNQAGSIWKQSGIGFAEQPKVN